MTYADPMHIREAIQSIHRAPDSWVRLDQVRRLHGGLDIYFSIHHGRRGKTTDHWVVTCRDVREIKITDFDGGGLAVYPCSHPAARQYVARRAELRWPQSCVNAQVLMALHQAHRRVADDWIPCDRYLVAPASGGNFVCRGPEFLLRAYVKALKALGKPARITLRGSLKMKSTRPQVLHFGESYVVANRLSARKRPIEKSLTCII
jgi:hypothetical protein